MEKLVLIDGNSLINRAFYAMPLLTTQKGEYTNAVYGFMNMFIKMLESEKPTAIAVAFDLKAPTFRHKMYSDYKGTRKPMPEELRPQIPLLKDLLRLMGITVVEKEGFEADDIIGTIAKATDIETIIITGDKDSFQLVDEQTEIHFTKRGITDTDVYTLANFTEKTGISPNQVIDLKALMGDTSDNIPGIPGVGEKTALTLVQTYGSVDGLYQNTDKLKGKLLEKVLSGRDLAYLSRTLATIDLNAPVDTDVSKMAFNFPFDKKVKERFIELEFKSLFRKGELFAETGEQEDFEPKENEPLPVPVKIADDLSIATQIPFTDGISIYFADDGVHIFDGRIEHRFPVRQTLLDDGFELSAIVEQLKSLFQSNIKLTVYNKKDLAHFLKKNFSVSLTAPCDDVSILKYLVDFAGKSEKAEEVFEVYGLDQASPAYALYYLKNTLYAKLVGEEMQSLYEKVELPLSDVLFDMEDTGFKIDVDALYKTGEKYQQILVGLESEIRALVGEETLNVNSPKQLGDVIFDKLKLGKGKKTKHGYSTTAEILENLENTHPVIPLILKYRQLQKLHSTYIEGFKPLIDKTTGLIHTSFNQTMTSTGRLSSKEPNLQNIPVRDDEGRELRKFFIPSSDEHVLVGADYSQIELRLLAAFSGCRSLINAFNSGKDIHAQTASKVFSTPLDKVTPTQRSNAKAVNFGIIYGMSEYGLAKQLKIPPWQAREYINSYFAEYPEVKEYMEKNVEFARQNGYAITLLGRKRQIREILSTNFNLRSFGERAAMNMPLQGSSADIIKLAMLGVHKRLKEEGLKSKLILQIHDELIIDALVSEKDRVELILKEEMENAVSLPVKLTVGSGSGKNWYEAK
ncbi:MAG: DNA polymerase I [Clostridia bacterium]|nr:DNA polymerase I [Clostridia bacterium]